MVVSNNEFLTLRLVSKPLVLMTFDLCKFVQTSATAKIGHKEVVKSLYCTISKTFKGSSKQVVKGEWSTVEIQCNIFHLSSFYAVFLFQARASKLASY